MFSQNTKPLSFELTNKSQSNLQTYSKKPQKLVTIRNKEDYVLVD